MAEDAAAIKGGSHKPKGKNPRKRSSRGINDGLAAQLFQQGTGGKKLLWVPVFIAGWVQRRHLDCMPSLVLSVLHCC